MNPRRRSSTTGQRTAVVVGWSGALALFACTDTATNPREDSPGRLFLPDVVVSEATSAASAHFGVSSSVGVSYVSLPPGALANVIFVRVRNTILGGPPTPPIVVIDGGFDPVPISATEGDELELELTHPNGTISFAYVTVPARRPPRIVRTSPPAGRTDVALSTRPEVILSEPIDPRSVTQASIRLLLGGVPVEGLVVLRPSEPWVAVFTPAAPLQPRATYQLVVTQDVRDLQGEALEIPFNGLFTTGAAEPPILAGKIAFVSTRDGSPHIYVANADGTAVIRLTSGEAPAWSRDGREIAFHRDPARMDGGIYVMDADGSNKRWLTRGKWPAWSPDGTRIAFVGEDGLSIMNTDGFGVTILVRHHFRSDTFRPWDDGIGRSDWSPDGRRIAFEHLGDSGPQHGFMGTAPPQVYLINADGSELRQLRAYSIPISELAPVWSPGASAIAYRSHTFGIVISTADGSIVRSLFHNRYGEWEDPGLTWSPDGQWLAFDTRDAPWNLESRNIYFVHRDGGEVRQLITDGYDAVWAPRD